MLLLGLELGVFFGISMLRAGAGFEVVLRTTFLACHRHISRNKTDLGYWAPLHRICSTSETCKLFYFSRFKMDADESTARKRQKTLMACEHCRGKKVRCDGQRPVCGNCTRKGWSSDKCIWKYVNGFQEVSSGASVESLHARIRELEEQIKFAGSSTSNPQRLAHEAGGSLNTGGKAHTESSGSPLAVNEIEAAATGEPQSEGFVGPGSAAAFLSTVRLAVDPRTSLPSPKRVWPQAPQSDSPLDYVLPPRREADALLDLYWLYVHPLYLFLYKPGLQKIYSGLWTGEISCGGPSSLMQTSEASSVALVNLVLALGYQYSGKQANSGTRHAGATLAEEHFNRARSAFKHDLLDGAERTLQAVQVMLLMAQYLSSIGSTHRAWEVIGSGVKACYRLGLHRAQLFSEHALLTSANQEMVKRVWHGCIMLER